MSLTLLIPVLYLLFNDSELEHWAKNGPFRTSDDGLDDALKWMHNDQEGFPSYEYLMGVFYQPEITFEHLKLEKQDGYKIYTGDFIAKFRLPVLFPDAKVVDLETHRYNQARIEVGGELQDSSNHVHNEIEPKPKEGTFEYDEDGRPTHNFYFEGDNGEDNNNGNYVYHLRGRIQAAKKLKFPVIPQNPDGVRVTRSDDIWKDHFLGWRLFNYTGEYKDTGYVYGTTTFHGGNHRWLNTGSSVAKPKEEFMDPDDD